MISNVSRIIPGDFSCLTLKLSAFLTDHPDSSRYLNSSPLHQAGEGAAENKRTLRFNQRDLLFDDTVIDRTDIRAARRVILPFAFNTFVWIDDIDSISLEDGFVQAFRNASAARDTIFCNFHAHVDYSS
jgi:hypothetical protein